jgi:methylenetetrahydrofolate dehydrogenase (NADP+)/methenyltetrahydrofolate cyclohydrolase
MGELLTGRPLADQIYEETRAQIGELRDRYHRQPKMVIITAGTKDLTKHGELLLHAKVARSLGIEVDTKAFDDTATDDNVIQAIASANADRGVHGILVLLPLPEQIHQLKAILAIAPEKELEGLREPPEGQQPTQGKKPSTIAAVLTLLKQTSFNIISGRGALVIDDEIVDNNAVVLRLLELITKTKLPLEIVRTSDPDACKTASKADVVLVSVTRPECVGADFLRKDAVVIDFNPIMVGQMYSEKQQRMMPIMKNGVKLDEGLARIIREGKTGNDFAELQAT